MNKSNLKKNKLSDHGFVANATGALVQATLVTITGYPFDLVKTRMQSNLYPTTLGCFKGTIKNEGLAGLYRGFAMPSISHLIKRPVQYTVAENLKTKTTNAWHNYVIGAGSGILGSVFGTPLQVIKVAMQTSTESVNKNSWDYAKYNYAKHGIQGFYRGFVPTLTKDAVFGMSFIGTYYTLRDYSGTDQWYKNFINGAGSHCITWCTFMPIDYVKTTIQKSEKKLTIRDAVKSSYGVHGPLIFWKGVIPACLRTIPVTGIAMTGYEFVRSLITFGYTDYQDKA
jgi:solute carrier family 25 (mitochondrial carnitine/acylcarnitine transporter), member 20/29